VDYEEFPIYSYGTFGEKIVRETSYDFYSGFEEWN
jgi:hypothetical protein